MMTTHTALGQPIQKIYETTRVFTGGTHSDYQYALLADGRWAFRMRSDRTGQHRASMSWTRWTAANGQPDIIGYNVSS